MVTESCACPSLPHSPWHALSVFCVSGGAAALPDDQKNLTRNGHSSMSKLCMPVAVQSHQQHLIVDLGEYTSVKFNSCTKHAMSVTSNGFSWLLI